MRVLILGGTGMLGHKLAQLFGPIAETIVAVRIVGPRRAEVETRRASGLTRGTRVYILLKTKGAWLIDSNKVRDGEPGIL